MGEAFIVRKGGVTSEATAAPTITEVSKTDTSITFTVTNNDAATATVYYDFDDEVTSLSEDNVTLATTVESDNIEITGLTAETEYEVYAVASAFNKQFSPQVSLAITTDETPIIPEYEELFSTTVATATTQIDITGLSIGKDDTLRLVYTFVGDSTTTANYDLRVNNITSNYHTQVLASTGSSPVAIRNANSSSFTFADSNRKSAGFADIKISNNDRFVSQSQFSYRIGSDSANIVLYNYNIVNTDTVTSITSLKIVSSRTNGIAVGSKIALYKVTEAA